MSKNKGADIKRYWEIDAFRGFVIMCMIIFHTFFVMVFFDIVWIDLWSGFFWWFPRFIAGSFIFIVGVSLTISYSRAKQKNTIKFKKFLIRGLKIMGIGFVITAVTFIGFFVLENLTGIKQLSKVVYFGILHCIGLSIIIGFFFIRFKFINLIIGLVILVFGFYINGMRFTFPWLFWLGFWPEGYSPIDYEPLLPWIGPMFLGLGFGNFVYKNGMRPFKMGELSTDLLSQFFKGLGFLGRHSLIIYLIHVPTLAGIIFAVNWIIGMF